MDPRFRGGDNAQLTTPLEAKQKGTVMLNKFKGLLVLPTFGGDEDKTRVAGLLQIMPLSFFIIGVTVIPITILIEGSNPGVVAIFALAGLMAPLLWFIARRAAFGWLVFC
jgi:hypothetical protein